MNVFTLASRVAVAAPFVYLGWQAARQPGGRVKAAEAFGIPADLSDLAVRANGAAMVAGGLSVATGILPRLGAAGVLAALVPTTIAGHPFWKETDPQARAAQLTQALKNLGMAGGLLAVVAAPGGRTPS
ncbi:DoxX family protein [Propioniciclava coleopterorum]|uniref:DoxX family protein n=1 Tax=Propioniciclava coleopterorum TaxID=2714937 RepID=A0A6G7Y6Q5_9ACTN|nr:DoxX family membrane protein [Propioniciclava coleopterorum]QIK72328.1 DoxX family protein [Propioniciclava coleopterorum]